MSPHCGEVVDRLPDWSAGRLGAAEAEELAEHLAGCASCAAESALLGSLVATRPVPPPDLAARILAAARSDAGRAAARAPTPRRDRRWTPAWALSAAAVLALALGTLTHRPKETAPAPPIATTLGEVPVEDGLAVENAVWISDDGVVAGAPVLNELSDENLVALLEEMGG